MTFIDQAPKEFNMEPPFALCEKTVQYCIEVVDECDRTYPSFEDTVTAIHSALEALLPKPPAFDRIESLWQDWCLETGGSNDPRDFARWIINEKGAL